MLSLTVSHAKTKIICFRQMLGLQHKSSKVSVHKQHLFIIQLLWATTTPRTAKMEMRILIVCFLLTTCHFGISRAVFPPIRSLGYTDMSFAAFSQILHNSQTGTEDLVVSTFNGFPNTKDMVYVVQDIATQVGTPSGGNDLTKEVLTQDLYWPNELEEVPGEYM